MMTIDQIVSYLEDEMHEVIEIRRKSHTIVMKDWDSDETLELFVFCVSDEREVDRLIEMALYELKIDTSHDAWLAAQED